MPLTATGKNEALTGATKKMEWVGLFTQKTFKAEASAAGTKIKLSKSEAEGFTNGTVVFLTKLEGGTGLKEGRVYYVVGAKTAEFEVALEEGATAVSFSTEVKSGTEWGVLKEISGGSYKRVKTSWGSASKGEIAASAAIKIAVPASTTVAYAGWWTAETGGTLEAAEKLEHEETYTGAGEYELTSDKLEANTLA